jgi:hypothetical protein
MPVEQREQVTHVRWSQRATGGTPCLDGRRQPSLGGTSRMNREIHVRICGRLGVQFPGPTRRSQHAAVPTAISKSPASRCGCLRTRSSATRRVKLHLYGYLCGNGFAVFGRGGKSPSVHCFHRSRIKRGTQRARDSKVMRHALSVDDATQFNTAFMTRIPLSFGILWLGRVSCTRWRCTVGRISVIATTPLRVAPHRLTLSSVFARS